MSNIHLGDRIEARFLFDEFKKKFMSGKKRSMKLKNLQKVTDRNYWEKKNPTPNKGTIDLLLHIINGQIDYLKEENKKDRQNVMETKTENRLDEALRKMRNETIKKKSLSSTHEPLIQEIKKRTYNTSNMRIPSVDSDISEFFDTPPSAAAKLDDEQPTSCIGELCDKFTRKVKKTLRINGGRKNKTRKKKHRNKIKKHKKHGKHAKHKKHGKRTKHKKHGNHKNHNTRKKYKKHKKHKTRKI